MEPSLLLGALETGILNNNLYSSVWRACWKTWTGLPPEAQKDVRILAASLVERPWGNLYCQGSRNVYGTFRLKSLLAASSVLSAASSLDFAGAGGRKECKGTVCTVLCLVQAPLAKSTARILFAYPLPPSRASCRIPVSSTLVPSSIPIWPYPTFPHTPSLLVAGTDTSWYTLC